MSIVELRNFIACSSKVEEIVLPIAWKVIVESTLETFVYQFKVQHISIADGRS